jgi:hypothetical protein
VLHCFHGFHPERSASSRSHGHDFRAKKYQTDADSVQRALVRAAGLENTSYIAIDLDDKTRSAVFVAFGSIVPRGIPRDAKFPLIRDGGQRTKKSVGRAIYVHRNRATDLVEGKYPAEFKRQRDRVRITIDLDPTKVAYKSPDDVPSGIGGVYRLVDGDGETIDIGMSLSDVRGRIRTKWSNELGAYEVLVYRVTSKQEGLHWERVFHRRHVVEKGALPKYCAAMGAGCGCAMCGE